jgi:hypothetical protein
MLLVGVVVIELIIDLAPAWHLPGTCLAPAWHLPGTCLAPACRAAPERLGIDRAGGGFLDPTVGLDSAI